MKIFELHFNPKNQESKVFDSFVYEPENPAEESLGRLCMVGELTRALPQNIDFLEKLSQLIKNEYYAKGDFGGGLKEANLFLEKEAKRGNVQWLGNLNFAILNFKNYILNFTKVGSMRILLLKEGEILDIGQNLELQDTEPYPLKVFSNTASGKLSSDDKILILSKELFNVLSQNSDFLNQLSQINQEKELKVFLKKNRRILSELSGVGLLITEGSGRSLPTLRIPYLHIFPIPKKLALILVLALLLIISHFLFR